MKECLIDVYKRQVQLPRHKVSSKKALDKQQLENRVGKADKKMVDEQLDGGSNEIQPVIDELNALVGLKEIKKLVHEIYAYVEIQKRRQKEKLFNEPQALHMIFKGNPGTGKTTVARIIGKLLKAAGILPKGHLVEVERADLVGEYIGHTAQKTRDMLKKSKGGVMFVDEAYSLARGGDKDFGKEAIDALVKGMEDHKDSLVVVLAGYQEEMDLFLESNPGLRSRFPIHLSFPDYTTDDLMEIADLMLHKKEYQLNLPAREELRRIVNLKSSSHKHSGNARLVRNMVEKSIRQQAVRLIALENTTRDELMTIIREDIVAVWHNY